MSRPVQLIRPDKLGFGEGCVSPPGGGWHMLAEGDSWFSFGSLGGNSLLNKLRFERSTLVTATSKPGDTLSHVVDWWRDPNFSALIDGGSEGQRAWKFDAILLSGGGNDLIDAVNDQLVDQQLLRLFGPGSPLPATAADCVHEDAWQRFENYLRVNFASVSQLVAHSAENSGTPVFVHTYDYPTPNDAGALPGGKSWLLPAMVAHNIPPSLWQPLSDHLIQRLAGVVRSLPGALPNVHVIDTLNTLVRAAPGSTGQSNDWLNEIHPTAGGYAKLALKWKAVVEAQL